MFDRIDPVVVSQGKPQIACQIILGSWNAIAGSDFSDFSLAYGHSLPHPPARAESFPKKRHRSLLQNL